MVGQLFHIPPADSGQQSHIGAGTGGIPHIAHPIFHPLRQDSHTGQAVRRQVGAELSGDQHLVQILHADAGPVQQGHEAGENRPFRQLNLTHISLGDPEGPFPVQQAE